MKYIILSICHFFNVIISRVFALAPQIVSKRRYYVVTHILIISSFATTNCSNNQINSPIEQTVKYIKSWGNSFETPCDELKYMMSFALQLHVDKRPEDHNSLYQSAFISMVMYIGSTDGVTKKDAQQIVATFQLNNEECSDISDADTYFKSHISDYKKSNKELMDIILENYFMNLDPHSRYLGENFVSKLSSPKPKKALGIIFNFRVGHIYYNQPIDHLPVLNTVKGSPAENILFPYDKIVEINSNLVSSMGIHESLKLLSKSGEDNSPLLLKVERKKRLITVKINSHRELIHPNSTTLRISRGKNKFGYIKLFSFGENSANELKTSIHQLDNIDGLIIDLRNNPGGRLSESLEMIDIFIQKGNMLYTKGRPQNHILKKLGISSQYYYQTINNLSDYYGPLVVLLNHRSASASELLAGVLQVKQRALIVGEKSFGKGTVQHLFINDGANRFFDRPFKITTERYFMPNGSSPQLKGVLPDIKIIPPEQTEWQEKYKESYLHTYGEKPIIFESDYKNPLKTIHPNISDLEPTPHEFVAWAKNQEIEPKNSYDPEMDTALELLKKYVSQ